MLRLLFNLRWVSFGCIFDFMVVESIFSIEHKVMCLFLHQTKEIRAIWRVSQGFAWLTLLRDHCASGFNSFDDCTFLCGFKAKRMVRWRKKFSPPPCCRFLRTILPRYTFLWVYSRFKGNVWFFWHYAIHSLWKNLHEHKQEFQPARITCSSKSASNSFYFHMQHSPWDCYKSGWCRNFMRHLNRFDIRLIAKQNLDVPVVRFLRWCAI